MKFQSEIRNQCRRDLNCSRAMGSYTCVCFFPADITMAVSPSGTGRHCYECSYYNMQHPCILGFVSRLAIIIYKIDYLLLFIATSSTLHLVAPKSTVAVVEASSDTELSKSGSSQIGEVVGVVLGTVTVVISVVLATTAAILAVFRYRKKRATETLAPWPEPRR